jgi:hypothetical protein
MFDEYKEYKVVSNNPLLKGKVSSCLELVSGGALSVFEKARDYIHLGWTLLNHPLYGNFTPKQQPYRTILLGRKAVEDHRFHQVDLDSLQLIEGSIQRFSSGFPEGANPLSFKHFSQEILDDFATVDLYLVSVNLERYGIKLNTA